MKKEEVLKKIESIRGCYTCVYSCNEQGNNGAYHCEPVDGLLDEEIEENYNAWCLKEDAWVLDSFESITNNDIDIDIWAQEFNHETIDIIRKQIDEVSYYLAVFSNDNVGTQKILVWED